MDNATFKDEVIELITCNICREFIGHEIFQCSMGHIYCFNCARHLNSCAVCRSPMPNSGIRTGIRNRALERMLQFYENLPCLQEGCDIVLPFNELEEHYNKCEHRIVSCPSRTCSWTGKINEYESHIIDEHDDVHEIKSGKIEIRLKNPSSLTINAYAEQIIKFRDNFFMWATWIIKGQRTPSSFTFSIIHLCPTTENTRTTIQISSKFNNCKFTCERSPWNLSDAIQDIRRSSHNLTIEWDVAIRIGQSGVLYRDLDQLKLEPKANSLDLPITLTFSDITDKYFSRTNNELYADPLIINLIDIDEDEND